MHPSLKPNKYERLSVHVTAVRYIGTEAALRELSSAHKVEENEYDGYCLLFTKQGVIHMDLGEWLVRFPDGTVEVLTDAAFGRNYEPV